jgi:hypothetical protein
MARNSIKLLIPSSKRTGNTNNGSETKFHAFLAPELHAEYNPQNS